MISRIFTSIHSRIKQHYQQKTQTVDKNEIKETPIPIEQSSQLIIGRDFVLDMNNPQLQKRLNEKRVVKVGKNNNCDIKIPSFYNGLINTPVVLQKNSTGIKISGSRDNGNVQVVDKKDIKPFYFGTKDIKFAQENTGDCYLLSTLYSLSRTSFGENFLREMVSIDENGNYIVKFHNKKPIIIMEDELYGENSKSSVTGELGLKAIERAYGKLINPMYKVLEAKEAAKRNMLMLDKGGFMTTALFNLTGLRTNEYKTKETNLDFLLKDIKEYGFEHQILTCSTPAKGKYGRYMDKNKKFISAHAYSIKEIDLKQKTIEIVNPHNTKDSEIISWDDFKEMFEYICVARLKKDT